MNKYLKKILLGLIIWAVPFVVSFFVWDVQTNAPRIGMYWFNALMALCWAVGFVIALKLYFKNLKRRGARKDGLVTGVIWYVELILLDLIVLVGLFGMALTDFYPMLLTYLNTFLITAAVGCIFEGK